MIKIGSLVKIQIGERYGPWGARLNGKFGLVVDVDRREPAQSDQFRALVNEKVHVFWEHEMEEIITE